MPCTGRSRKRAWPHAALAVLVLVEDEQRRRRPTPAHASAGEGRLSNLQGHEDVQGRRSERRSQGPLGQYTPWCKGEVRSAGCQSLGDRLLVGRRQLFLWSPLRRQVFIVISNYSRRQDGSNDPSIIDLGRHQEKDQKVGEPSHLRGRLLVQATPTQPHHVTCQMGPRQPEQRASGRPFVASVLMGTSLYFLPLPQGQGAWPDSFLWGMVLSSSGVPL
jgi:hypothetical protein